MELKRRNEKVASKRRARLNRTFYGIETESGENDLLFHIKS